MYWPHIGNGQRVGAAGILALTLLFSPLAPAQETHGTAIDRDIATLTQQIATKQQQIATLRGRPSPEQAELNSAQARLAEAQTAFKAKSSAENESRAKNAEFKVKLAEIKYNKAYPDVGTLVDELEQLQTQLAAKQREAREPREAAVKPPAEPAPKTATDNQAAKRQQEQQRQQEQELTRTRQESEAQQKEIERLKAALAAKESKEAKEKETTTANTTPPVASPSPKTAAAQAAVTKAPESKAGGVVKLVSAQEVTQELQQLEVRIAAPGPARGANDALYLKRPDTKATNKDKIILRALGKEQYRGQAAVEAGQYLIAVGFNQWPVEFAASEAGQTTFLYDNSDTQKARLLIYNSALESGK